jgi:hypothetical protein
LLPLNSSDQLTSNKLFTAQIQPHSAKDAHLQQQQILANQILHVQAQQQKLQESSLMGQHP